jgi:dTDP-4-dehydrorhamnose reductase
MNSPGGNPAGAGRPRILVTGAGGQLGFELAHWLGAFGEVVAVDRPEIDLADPDAIRRGVRAVAPRLIVNAAAYTAVDRAETEAELAHALNARAPEVLAEEAQRSGAALIHYSTDYVFDGAGDRPYTEDAPTAPLNVYGATKLAGERAVLGSGADALVLRTSWVYGLRGANFLLTMRRLAAQRDELRIVADQTGTPNWCRELARATARIVADGLPALAARKGLYHLSSTGSTTWYDFARAILGEGGPTRVLPIATADYPTPARRPRYGVLDTRRFERTFGFGLPPWRDALERCVASPAEPSPSGDSPGAPG